MILRRVTQHVKDQNWTAIAIDFVIVVVGVFVGIQVSNWNEARVQADAQAAMLQRLHEEFVAVEAALAEAVENSMQTVRSTGVVIEAIRAGTPPEDSAAFKDALRLAQYVWAAPAQSATYSEMVATGALSRLTDPALRAALTRYGDHAARYALLLPEALAVVLAPDSNFLQAVEWSVDDADWSTSDGIVGYDWERLQASQAELQAWQAYQVDVRNYSQGQLEELHVVLKLLEAQP